MTTNTGGPAYPTSNYGAIVPMSTGYSEGMTLRDYFAAKAMQAVFTGAIMEGLTMNQDINCDKAAETAYTMADAMLKARELK
jgi:hypothetical protein